MNEYTIYINDETNGDTYFTVYADGWEMDEKFIYFITETKRTSLFSLSKILGVTGVAREDDN